MNSDFYKKLVDLYAGRELPAELEDQMELAAFNDATLNHDMVSLRKTVDLLKTDRSVEFTEESYQRILMKLYARGGNIQPRSPEPAHLQYHLPIQG
ncbi:MAG TPA: hypothetical protein VG944_02160 [Fimbriimonas sp.]|nr:hypothetical protein [Fimbriimonas sp.]